MQHRSSCAWKTGAAVCLCAFVDGESRLDQRVPEMSESRPLDEFVNRYPTTWARRLAESGLYEKEARAMVNTWAGSYFKTDGVRVLFVLPSRGLIALSRCVSIPRRSSWCG